MKKLLLTVATIAGLMLTPLVASAADMPGKWTIGATLSSNSLDTAGTEVANGVTTKKTVSDDFVVGSIFLENTIMGEKGGITFGVDYIPFDADIDKRSISQSSLKAIGDGAASSGTNSVSGTISEHTTLYIAPGVKFGEDSLFYFSYGLVSADLNGKSVSVSHTY